MDYVCEMGYDFDVELLFFFDKFVDVLILVDGKLFYLLMMVDLYYEGELVVGLVCGGVDLILD